MPQKFGVATSSSSAVDDLLDGALAGDVWAGVNGKAHPVVLVIRALLADRPKADTIFVVDALLERFQDEDDDGMVAQAIDSMRTFRDRFGGTSAGRVRRVV